MTYLSRIIEALKLHPGELITKEALYEYVYGVPWYRNGSTALASHVCIARHRVKGEIVCVPNRGYIYYEEFQVCDSLP